jgi:hypothetical protein
MNFLSLALPKAQIFPSVAHMAALAVLLEYDLDFRMNFRGFFGLMEVTVSRNRHDRVLGFYDCVLFVSRSTAGM